MGSQQRFFGRWLMPLFPLVALLAGWAAVELGRWPRSAACTSRGSPPRRPIGVCLLAQSLVWVVHDDRVLARPDTRNLTRAWMVAHVPAGEKIVIEPVVPDNWTTDVGATLPWTPNGDRWYRYPTSLTRRRRPTGSRCRRVNAATCASTSTSGRCVPQLIDEYVRSGFCWLVIGSLQAGRALSQPRSAPRAVAYYAALAPSRPPRLPHLAVPHGENAVPFNFDWSIDYFPRQYEDPGPEMSVLRLRGGRCGAGS